MTWLLQWFVIVSINLFVSISGQCYPVNWEHIEPLLQTLNDLSNRLIQFQTGLTFDQLIAERVKEIRMSPVELTDFLGLEAFGYTVRAIDATDLVNFQADPPEVLDQDVLYGLAVADRMKMTVIYSHPIFRSFGLELSMDISDIRMQGQFNILMYQCNSMSWYNPLAYYCSLGTIYDLLTKEFLDVVKSRTGKFQIEKMQTDIGKVENIQVAFVKLNEAGHVVRRQNSSVATIPLRIAHGIDNRLPEFLQQKRALLIDSVAKFLLNRLIANEKQMFSTTCPTSWNYQA